MSFDNITIKKEVKDYINSNLQYDKSDIKHISNWDVSGVTDMSELFKDLTNFNDDISNWNVSNVTNMTNMFSYAESFNQKYKPIKNYSPSIKRAFINYKINIQDRSNSKSNINYNVKRINLKNTEIGTGMAWEIHKVFNEYYILDFYKEVYAFNCSKKYTTIKENRFISTLTNWINMDTINLKNKELENFFICIKQVNQKLLNISLDNNFILLLSVVFTFIQNNFEKDDQHKYAYNIYYDNCAAYGNKIEVIDGNIDGMTCAKGLIERIVVNVINIFSAKRNDKSGLYKKPKLTSVFGFFPPKKEKNIYNSFFMEKEFLEYMNDWKEVNNGKIKQIINKDKDIPNKLKDNFFKHLTIKYNKTKETCIKTKYVKDIIYYFEKWSDYLDDEYLNKNYDEKATGGKHKKTLKVKHKMTKRKKRREHKRTKRTKRVLKNKRTSKRAKHKKKTRNIIKQRNKKL